MKPTTKNRLIVKFINGEANQQDLDNLEELASQDKLGDAFQKNVYLNYIISLCMKEYNLNKAKDKINVKAKAFERRRKIAFYTKIAAVIVLLLFSSVFVFNTWLRQKQSTQLVKSSEIKPGYNKAVLTLSNGNQVVLEKGEAYSNQTVKSDGKEIIYESSKTNQNKDVQFNELDIPRGGEFSVKLSDGTKIWLNSETKLRYPIQFVEGKAREVELMYGEAYFEVSPSTDHKGAVFKVKSSKQKVTVLGTEFNISAVKGENEITTTLVEGKVTIDKNKVTRELKPGQQSRIYQDKDVIDIYPVDVFQEISWVKGLFSFEEITLEKMMSELSRWYDTEVAFETSDKKKYQFTGVLERTKNIEDILKLVEETTNGEIVFEIKNKTIIVK